MCLQNAAKRGIQDFTVPPERYISTPTEVIEDDLLANITKAKGSQDKEKVLKLTRLIESISQYEFANVRRRINQNFLTLAAAATGRTVPGNAGPGPTEEELDEMEMTFMEDMFQLMQASHFRLLSKEDWDTAQEEQFTFNSPVEVNWDYMDGELLQRFWAGHADERAGAASIADRILVFHRGISTVRAEGQYLNDKIDLLVQYLLVDPFQALYQRIFKHKAKLHVALEMGDSTGDKGYSLGKGPPATGVKPDNSIEMSSSVAAPHAPSSAADVPPEEDSRLQHSAAQTVQRQSLKRLMPDAGAVLRSLFATLQVQEPTFKNVVVLYRRKVASSPQRKSEYEPIRSHNLALERRNIHIKRFAEIPMADAEMVFPDKKIYLKPLLLIQLAIAIIGGIIAAFTALLSGKLSAQVLLTTLSVAGGRAMQVYTSANFTRARVVDQVTQQLYEQMMDTQEGVVYLLLEEMAQQRIKEYLLAYALLLIHGRAMTQAELDGECEAYLQQRYGESLDFAIENSLPFLLRDGLISHTPQGSLQAAPLEVACARLSKKWDACFDQPDDDAEESEAGEAEAVQEAAAGRKGKKRRSLFSKLRLSHKSFLGEAPEQEPVSAAPAPILSEPMSTAVDTRAGIITVETPPPVDPSSLTHRIAPDGSAASAAEEADQDGEDSGTGSKRSKVKEGLASFFGKGPKKDQ